MGTFPRKCAPFYLPVKSIDNVKTKSASSASVSSFAAASNACSWRKEKCSQEMGKTQIGIEGTKTVLDDVPANAMPEEVTTSATGASECTDASEVADVAQWAASLLTRAAQHIETFQAEQQRQQLAVQQRQRQAKSSQVFHQATTSTFSRDGGERWSDTSDYLPKCRVAAEGPCIAGALSDAPGDLKGYRDRRRAAAAIEAERKARFFSCEPETVLPSTQKLCGSEETFCRQFRQLDLQESFKETTQTRLLKQKEVFSRQLQQMQRRHLRKLQRQQQEKAQERKHNEGCSKDRESEHVPEKTNRAFTHHGLRRKAAALFKDAVRKGILAGTLADELKVHIGSSLYEAPSKKEIEEAELKECTFRPKINKNASIRRFGNVPWWERLHAEARRILENETEEQNSDGKPYKSKESELNWQSQHPWNCSREKDAQENLKKSFFASNCPPGGGAYKLKNSIRWGVCADSQNVNSSSLSQLSLKLSSSGTSRLLSKNTKASGKECKLVSTQLSKNKDSSLNGSTLLQWYLGSEAPAWLRSNSSKDFSH